VAKGNGSVTYPWLESPPESSEPGEPAKALAGSGVVAPVPRVCLSRPEAAQALGLGVSTLKRLERDGLAPPSFDAPGGRKLYPVRSLTEWAEQRARSAASSESSANVLETLRGS